MICPGCGHAIAKADAKHCGWCLANDKVARQEIINAKRDPIGTPAKGKPLGSNWERK